MFSENSTVAEILTSPEASAVVEKYIKNFQKHPMLKMVKNMTLKQIAAAPQAGIRPETLKAMSDELMKLG